MAKENPSVVVNEVTARIGRGGLCSIRLLDHTFVCRLMDRCGRQNEGGEGRTNSLSADRGTTQFEMDHYKECWPVGILSNGVALLICPFDIRQGLGASKTEAQKIRPYYRAAILSTSLHQHLYVEAAGLHRMSSSYLRIRQYLFPCCHITL